MKLTGIDCDHGYVTICSQEELTFAERVFCNACVKGRDYACSTFDMHTYKDILNNGCEEHMIHTSGDGSFAMLKAYKDGNEIKVEAFTGYMTAFVHWVSDTRKELAELVVKDASNPNVVDCVWTLLNGSTHTLSVKARSDMYMLALKNSVVAFKIVHDIAHLIVDDYAKATSETDNVHALLRSAFVKVTSERELALNGELGTEEDARILGEACSEISKAIYLLDGSNNIDEK